MLRRAAIRLTSLEAPIGDDETNRVADVVKDESADTPYEQLEEKTNSALVHEMVGTLDSREQAILRQRFGLDGGERKTLEQIGEQFGVTRERIRQIEEIALKKLRKRIQDLRSEEHTSELQSPCNLVCRLLLEKKKQSAVREMSMMA